MDDDDPIGEVEDLLELAGDEQHADARRGRGSVSLVPTNSIAPTSRPRVGWAATSTFGSWASSRARTTALLVAARERPHRCVGSVAADGEVARSAPRPRLAGRPGRSPRGRPPTRGGSGPGSRRPTSRAHNRSRGDPRARRRPRPATSPRPDPWASPRRRRAPRPTSRRRRLDSTSTRGTWPLPSTPATPTISPGCRPRGRRRRASARLGVAVATAPRTLRTDTAPRSVAVPVGQLDESQRRGLVAQRHRRARPWPRPGRTCRRPRWPSRRRRAPVAGS